MKNLRIRINIQNIDFSKIVDSHKNTSFYKKIALKIKDYIESNNSASLQEILAYVGGGERRVIRLLDQMVNLGILKFTSSRFKLPHQKANFPFSISDVRCETCDSKVVNIEGKMKPLLNFIKEVLQSRPKPTFIFDQRPVNAETVVRRVAYMLWRGDLQNKRIVVIGDDDLISVALAQTRMAREIVVFDIDERIIRLIKKTAKSHHLNIKTIRHDIFLGGVPNRYMNYFDTFFTDPTPTLKPLTLFTGRGLQMLKKERGKVGYISLYPSHIESDIDFQKTLSRMDLLVTDLIPFFNQYEIIHHALLKTDVDLLRKYSTFQKTISFYEYLMRVETTSLSKPLNLKFSPIDLVGKATRQVLEDPRKDPVLVEENKSDFIKNYAQNLKVLMNKNKKNKKNKKASNLNI